MRKYYLDSEFRVHIDQDGNRREWEDTEGYFDGKCAAYIEGFRVVPDGETWVREDGAEFTGLMIAAAVPFEELDAIQREYERQQLAAMQEAIAETEAAEAAYNEGVQEA